MPARFRVHAALLLVQVFFGLWPVAGAALLEIMSPRALIGFRMLAATPLLLLAARLRGFRVPERKDLGWLALLGFLGVTANQILFAEGLLRAGPINAAVLVVIAPALTLALGMLLGDEHASPSKVLGITLAVSGAIYIIGADRAELGGPRFLGNMLLVLNIIFYSGYLVLARRVIGRLGAMTTLAFVFLFGTIEALPFTVPALASTPWGDFPPWAWGALLFVVLGPSLGAYGLNAYALKRANASLVAVYVTAQPVLASLGAFLFLQQRISLKVALGGLVIAIGVVLSSRKAERPLQPEEAPGT